MGVQTKFNCFWLILLKIFYDYFLSPMKNNVFVKHLNCLTIGEIAVFYNYFYQEKPPIILSQAVKMQNFYGFLLIILCIIILSWFLHNKLRRC